MSDLIREEAVLDGLRRGLEEGERLVAEVVENPDVQALAADTAERLEPALPALAGLVADYGNRLIRGLLNRVGLGQEPRKAVLATMPYADRRVYVRRKKGEAWAAHLIHMERWETVEEALQDVGKEGLKLLPLLVGL